MEKKNHRGVWTTLASEAFPFLGGFVSLSATVAMHIYSFWLSGYGIIRDGEYLCFPEKVEI
jgi:hypothetical protein